MAETPYGAEEGLELNAKDGDHLQVTASSVNGKGDGFVHPFRELLQDRAKAFADSIPNGSRIPNISHGVLYVDCLFTATCFDSILFDERSLWSRNVLRVPLGPGFT